MFSIWNQGSIWVNSLNAQVTAYLASEQLKEDSTQTPPITGFGFFGDCSNLYAHQKRLILKFQRSIKLSKLTCISKVTFLMLREHILNTTGLSKFLKVTYPFGHLLWLHFFFFWRSHILKWDICSLVDRGTPSRWYT